MGSLIWRRLIIWLVQFRMPICMSHLWEIGFGKLLLYLRSSVSFGSAYIKVFPLEKFFGARGLAVPISCPLCNVDVESIILILRDCPLAKEFWDSFPIPIQTSTFYGTNLLDWPRINWTNYHSSLFGISWSILFPFGVWCLWLRRNKVIFRDSAPQKSLKVETLAKASEFAFLGLNKKLQHSLSVIQV